MVKNARYFSLADSFSKMTNGEEACQGSASICRIKRNGRENRSRCARMHTSRDTFFHGALQSAPWFPYMCMHVRSAAGTPGKTTNGSAGKERGGETVRKKRSGGGASTRRAVACRGIIITSSCVISGNHLIQK